MTFTSEILSCYNDKFLFYVFLLNNFDEIPVKETAKTIGYTLFSLTDAFLTIFIILISNMVL